MTRTSRRSAARAAGLTLAAVLALSACGDDGGVSAGDVRSGAAAIVGDARISADDLGATVERGLADPTAAQKIGEGDNKQEYTRQTLTRLINHEVLTAAAEEQGVSVSDGDVDKRLDEFAQQAGGREALDTQAAQNGISPQDVRPFVRDLVLTDALGDKLVENEQVPPARLSELYKGGLDRYDQVHSAHILVKDKATADRLLGQVKADPTRFAALAAEFSTDTSNKDKGGDLGFAGRGQFVKPFSDAIFSAKPNTYVAVQSEFGWHVIHVQERRTTTLEQATPELRREALKEQRDTRLQEVLKKKAEQMGITVNPRFGRWDPESGAVVAAPVDTSTEAPDGGDTNATPPPGQGGAPGAPPPAGG